MALSLTDLRTVTADLPPRILIYGPEKMGKTTLAAEFPEPVFLQTERGESAGLEIVSFGHLTSFDAVMDAMSALGEENPFKTVVIDSLSELQKLVWAEVCKRNNWQSIEQPGYGKGYVEADYAWRELIDAMNWLRTERGMMVILIAHAEIDRFDDPETASYSRYAIDLHKRAEAMFKREVDAILLVKKDVSIQTEEQGFAKKRSVAKGSDQRWIYTEGRPAFVAGNRYGLPEKVPFKKGEGYTALAPYLPAQPQEIAPAKASASKRAA